jgi:hypothetical protein
MDGWIIHPPGMFGDGLADQVQPARGGGEQSNSFSGFQYSPHVANVIGPHNLAPVGRQ